MSTLITDTLKQKNNADFPIAEGGDIWLNDTSTAEAAIQPATATDLGVIKIGNNIILDDEIITVPNYLSIGVNPPIDGSKLWISTQDSFLPDNITQLVSSKENNLIKQKEDGLWTPALTNYPISSFMYLYQNDIAYPFLAGSTSANTIIYIDSVNGHDTPETKGTADDPFKSWSYLRGRAPRNFNNYELRIYAKGNFSNEDWIFNGFSNTTIRIYMQSNPTFKTLRFYGCYRVYLYDAFTCNLGTPNGNNHGMIFSCRGSAVYLVSSKVNTNWTITLNGSNPTNTILNTRGIYALQHSSILSTNRYCTIKISNCRFAVSAEIDALAAIYNTSGRGNQYGKHASYGVIRYASNGTWTSATTATSTSNGGRIYSQGNISGTAY